MNNAYEEQFLIRFSEGNRHAKLKLRAFFDYAQQVAAHHAEIIGVGFDALRQQNQVWLLARIKMQFEEFPEIDQTIRVQTYPAGFDRLFAIREYRFLTQDGTMLAKGTSNWLLVDTEKQRILPPQREYGSLLPKFDNLEIAFPLLDKLPKTMENTTASDQYKIRDTMVDINNHLNNAEYAAIVQNCIGVGKYPRTLQLNYQNAVPENEILNVQAQIDDQGFHVIGTFEDKQAFQATGTFMP